MAKLINGNGNLAIYAEEDADWFGSIFGNTTAITGIGNQFAYSLLDANTIGVEDGVIISKEGRRVQLNANEIDEFDIPTGAQGTTNYYIIGYRLYTDETSAQGCETFVELMDNGTDTISEDTFRGGADEVYISLYRVKQVDLAITQLTLLLPKVSTISEINQHLTDKVSGEISTYTTIENVAYDSENNKLMLKVEGADTPIPFSSKPKFIFEYNSYNTGYGFSWFDFENGIYSTTWQSWGGGSSDSTFLNNDFVTATKNGAYNHRFTIVAKKSGKQYVGSTETDFDANYQVYSAEFYGMPKFIWIFY